MKYSTNSGTMRVVPILELPLSLPVTDIQLIILRLGFIQTVASGCCDLIAKCIMVCINYCTYLNPPFYSPSKSSTIYRCWLIGIKISVSLSFLHLWQSHIGQSIYLHLISQLQLSPLATWLGSDYQLTSRHIITDAAIFTSLDKWDEGSMGMNFIVGYLPATPLDPLILTSFALSMAVNALMTALIVFKILKVFFEVKPTAVERTIGRT